MASLATARKAVAAESECCRGKRMMALIDYDDEMTRIWMALTKEITLKLTVLNSFFSASFEELKKFSLTRDHLNGCHT